LAPRYLGLKVVLAKSFARIHWQNLINFGVLPLTFAKAEDYDLLVQGDVLTFHAIHDALHAREAIKATVSGKETIIHLQHALSERQLDIFKAGGLINWMKGQL